MAVAREVGEGLRIAMQTNEGNVTVSPSTIVTGSGSTTDSWSWATPTAKGDFLDMDGDWRVKHAVANTQNLAGVAFDDPRWEGGEAVPWTASGVTTDYRTVVVELFGLFIRELLMATGAATSVVGGYVAPHASVQDEWDKDTTANNTFVLVAAAAGANSMVLMGWWGAF